MAEPINFATNFAIKIILSIFGPILKKPIEWITKFLFLDAYKVSTAYRTGFVA
ncbi:hypothetical protein ACVYA3_12890 [Acinetobacter baumannii]|uniref:hypothetical protein n=1 Tax=Acinetobacter baumannii TaxID=470 RepID=UPI00147C2476|nr:hypothetical protein [Acinetobacter baumannii]MCE6353158.1 hypothetical protein [Acinetobacter baumannii]MCE6357118.1 hypothetical protein [Acinetobacter baumannii]MCE6364785.1 hypothetical protein [Acinetobacter baumannii]MCE6368788.1 hypothetical protein [Acinetobacter baumannii]MCE6372681.1 hypothetical protein [Acinetobacter baumannii]